MGATDNDDWQELHAAASAATKRAYAPYSRYRVGAAARTTTGALITGCNVENAAYGVALCAECGLVSQLINTEAGQLTRFVCVNAQGDVIMPCGRCRQLLAEHAASDLIILTPLGERAFAEVLPQAFSAADLKENR